MQDIQRNLIWVIGVLFCSGQMLAQSLGIWSENHQYWATGDEPVLLLGGSDEDNLFQMTGVKAQLDTLAMVGGNYVRCTMSSRDAGNPWPFYLDEATGLYNLSRLDSLYWQRFADFLAWTAERQIFVQVEVWATFDFYRENWKINPFNPANNSNYDFERTELLPEVPTHPVFADNPFFTSIPSHRNNMRLLTFQQKFVDALLDHTLPYDHILYCMDNETSVTAAWGAFWSDYIRKRAREMGKEVFCTEMWDPWDLNHISHRESFDHPELYQFVEISQNNHHLGESHWQNGLAQIERLRLLDNLRPVTNVKIYGADGGRHGGEDRDAIEKFCRAILFGSASARFHRPTSGIGLSPEARKVIQSVRMATDAVDFFRMQPLDVLTEREENEAYCRGIPGQEYLVYFTEGGAVALPESGEWQVQWLSFTEIAWKHPTSISVLDGVVKLTCPGPGMWMVRMRKI